MYKSPLQSRSGSQDVPALGESPQPAPEAGTVRRKLYRSGSPLHLASSRDDAVRRGQGLRGDLGSNWPREEVLLLTPVSRV